MAELMRKVAALLVALAVAHFAQAQEIEPRTFVNTPTRLNFIAAGYSFQTGNVFFDPSLPIEDVSANLHIAFVRYLRTLTIGSMPAKITVAQPFASGHWEGFLDGDFRTRDASGMGDLRLAVDVLFWGARPWPVGEPPNPDEKTILGAMCRRWSCKRIGRLSETASPSSIL